MSYPPSPQQQAIYDAVLKGRNSLIVQATAGAGKSSTLVGIAERLAANGFPLEQMLFVAFNKAIVSELQEKLPPGVRACTMHSLGMQTLKDELGDLKLENFKYGNVIRDLLADEGILPRRHKDFRVISDSLKDLVNTIRITTFDYEDASKEELLHLLEDTQENFPRGHAGLITGLARDALNRGVKLAERRGEIDFTDMLWLPWKLGLTPKTQYEFLMLDEAQDQSPLQRWLCLKAVKRGGRVVAVGDEFQAIYGFSGASPDSMRLFKAALDAEEYPLSVTWRCPRSHVELAQAVIGEDNIQAAPNAKEGVVAEIGHQKFLSQIREGDAVLARTNRPLIAQAFEFIKAGRRAKIRGRDIGQGLIRSAEAIQKEYCREYTPEAFAAGVEADRVEKIGALYRRSDLNEEQIQQRIAELQDRAEVLLLIAENSGAKTGDALKAAIENLFDDGRGNFILLSTIHKAKGLEFADVYVIDPENLPAPFARRPEDKQGELCCTFVALTRAKESLFFVDGLPNHAGVRAVMARKRPPQGEGVA